MKTVIMAALATLLITGTAEAKPKRHAAQTNAVFDRAAQPAYPLENSYTVARRGGQIVQYTGEVVGGRPAGCPYRYCGCEVSLKVFGRIIPELNLAANWRRKFPRTTPAAGMVAARSGHVFYIQSVIDITAGTVMAYDPNSGGGRTRIHERSLRGYTIVDPHGNRYAMN